MMLENFKIAIKAKPGQGYLSNIYTIEKPYLLKPGDKLLSVSYEGRGADWRDVTILEVTKKSITIGDDWFIFNKGKTFTLLYNEEPDYRKILGPHYDIEPEKRKLEIRPFPTFIESFNKSMFNKAITPSTEWFCKKDKCFPVRDYEQYLKNFANLQGQISIFGEGIA